MLSRTDRRIQKMAYVKLIRGEKTGFKFENRLLAATPVCFLLQFINPQST